MLSELRSIHESLVASGVRLSPEHPAVKRVARSAGFVIGIGPDARPEWAEYRPADEMRQLWQLAPDNHNTFPAINFPPIIEDQPDLAERRVGPDAGSLWQSWVERIISTEPLSGTSFLERRFHSFAVQLLPVLRSAPSLQGYAVLAERLASVSDLDRFVREVALTALKATVDGGDESLALVELLVAGKWVANRQTFDRKSVKTPVFFDLADFPSLGFRVARVDAREDLSQAMLAAESTSARQGVCSISGRAGPLASGKFPQPNLPTLGPTYLFSANKDTPAQHNYGVFGAEAVAVGEQTVQEMHSALLHMTAEDRRGKTWQIMPDDRGARIVIAYVRERVDDLGLASLLVESPEALSDASYAETCSSVCKALRARVVPTDALLEMIILGKPDKGRAQVQHAAYKVGQVLRAAEDWQTASENGPQAVQIGRERLAMKPISPASVARLTQATWIRGGSKRSPVRGLPPDQIYESFLGEGPLAVRASLRLLEEILKRHSGLLMGPMAGDLARKDGWAAASLLATLLFKLGRTKELYMQGAPFQVGRLLALADTLHREYCRHVRKGMIPPQLLGNSLMHTALDSPTRGLARLSERILPYQAWAQQAQGNESALAKWALREMGEASNLIAEAEPPERTDELARAEILLGYLARTKKETTDDGAIQ